ncbi:hypothetical protein M0R45_035847 [Rubus argutus]|uniref:Uncharacterized protein n=1 Tax=Rubus argutus TaxID=59490 RepID=A0AAW1VVV2_RUBAR
MPAGLKSIARVMRTGGDEMKHETAQSPVTVTSTEFTFSALPPGSGGEAIASPNQNKRSRADDLLCNKTMAAQITNTESADPLPGPPLGSNSYASRLLNPLSHYGTASVEDFEITEEDYSINPVDGQT